MFSSGALCEPFHVSLRGSCLSDSPATLRLISLLVAPSILSDPLTTMTPFVSPLHAAGYSQDDSIAEMKRKKIAVRFDLSFLIQPLREISFAGLRVFSRAV